ncbi:MAG: serpin family protein [Acidimicrobiia bacterium]|nr:serpin family protein [Acidimicrobiia bacterium]
MRKMLVLSLAAALLAAACGSSEVEEPATSTLPPSVTVPSTLPETSTTVSSVVEGVLASSVARRPADAPAADVAAVTAGDAVFGADLLQVLGAGNGGNLAVSPLSIRLALAMAYAGARGETAAQMAQVLRYDLPDEALHAAFNLLDQALEERNQTLSGEGGEERRIEVSVSNALWGQAGLDVVTAFLDILAADYGAGMRVVDFAGAVEAARATINAWVAGETNDRIPELIPAGALTPQTLLVLTNAVYLYADWALPFGSEATADEPFTRLDGSQVTVPMMHQLLPAYYAAGDGWQAVDLGYVGGEVAMLLVLPDAGRFDEAAAAAGTLFGEAREALASTDVQLALPRFEFRTQASLPDALRALGMTAAFDSGRADFTGILADGGLFISDVIHEVFVAVNEAGTEAAAATAVIMGRGLPAKPVELTFDLPFLFWVYDRATGSVLFMGRVLDPAA